MVLPPGCPAPHLTSSRPAWDALCCSLRPLAHKYLGAGLARLEAEHGRQEVEQLLQAWPWWIFEKLEQTVLTRVLDCFFMEGHKEILNL